MGEVVKFPNAAPDGYRLFTEGKSGVPIYVSKRPSPKDLINGTYLDRLEAMEALKAFHAKDGD